MKGKLLKDRELLKMVVITVAVFIAMAALRPNLFLTGTNFTSMGYQIPELGLYSVAMTIVMLS